MEIRYLHDNMKYIRKVTDCIYEEFIDGIRDGVSKRRIEDGYRDSKTNELPVTLIAVECGECVGTVSLVKNDLKLRDCTPWLSSLYVDRDLRGRGLGRALIEEIIKKAEELGYDTIYLRTEHAEEYYIKLGWKIIERLTDEYDLFTTVFAKETGG